MNVIMGFPFSRPCRVLFGRAFEGKYSGKSGLFPHAPW
jgi:hypothetical protein